MASRPTTSRPTPGKRPGAKAMTGLGGKAGKGNRPSRRTPPPPVKPARPWGVIAATLAVILFAVGIIGYAAYTARQNDPDLARTRTIEGVTAKEFQAQDHTQGQEKVDYAETPPFGGKHDPQWADCSGTVYPTAIRPENAVHSLEHGAVWITYDPKLPKAQLQALQKLVEGNNFTMLSPYPGQDSAVSAQAWGSQLKLRSATDERLEQFVAKYKQGEQTPEPGASCSNPDFAANPLKPL